MPRDPSLATHAFQEFAEHATVPRPGPLRLVAGDPAPQEPLDLRREAFRFRPHHHRRWMTAPPEQLPAAKSRHWPRVRRIEDRNRLPGELAPERRGGARVIGAHEIVAASAQGTRQVAAVPAERDAAPDRRPGAMGADGLGPGKSRVRAARPQRRQRWQRPVRGPLQQQIRIRRVQCDQQKPRTHGVDYCSAARLQAGHLGARRVSRLAMRGAAPRPSEPEPNRARR